VVAKRKNVRTELQQAIVGLNIIGKLYWMATAPRDYTELAWVKSSIPTDGSRLTAIRRLGGNPGDLRRQSLASSATWNILLPVAKADGRDVRPPSSPGGRPCADRPGFLIFRLRFDAGPSPGAGNRGTIAFL